MIDNDPLIGKQLANFLIERVLGRNARIGAAENARERVLALGQRFALVPEVVPPGDAFGGTPNFGTYPMVNGQSRLACRFYEESGPIDAARGTIGTSLSPADAERIGLVTVAPDDLDWDDDEIAAPHRLGQLIPAHRGVRFAQLDVEQFLHPGFNRLGQASRYDHPRDREEAARLRCRPSRRARSRAAAR